ncbi:tagatose-6-phosphate ketose/aldose isomerase [Spiroplasma helicoides]|uniref:Tagatose-6-phosphate ketose/aldose isomerase n=1 Tax=Spiroplasma helicoides TaxID=216938 RepID=A0A1B3SK60_9MOLU|nr:SIS domain-containing protein [Spiroplasma helicoides]AOG60319.1 tagatose-6-phosphate ketose/aldose isomerase [Spiroplasma helicoides]
MNNNSYTEKEIYQQPEMWKQVFEMFESNKGEYQNLATKYKDYKIILTGAGTSQFVGDTIYNYFIEKGLDIHSIATTSIVVNPLKYIKKDEKVLLVSYARSGNSPESVAAVELVNQVSKNAHHIVVTCNEQGELYKLKDVLKNMDAILLPPETNDKGFAMTSSFSSMLLASSLLFSYMVKDDSFDKFNKFYELANNTLNKAEEFTNIIDLKNIDRLVFLGDCEFYGLTKEARLKLLELTQGTYATFYDTFLGFRHGPKSILSDKTLIFFLMSSESRMRNFEQDLIEEIYDENKVNNLFVLENSSNNKNFDRVQYINLENNELNNIYIALHYIMFFQIFALRQSEKQGFTPDNPCPTGEVNRVVKKFTVYKGEF